MERLVLRLIVEGHHEGRGDLQALAEYAQPRAESSRVGVEGETSLFEYTLSSTAEVGVMNHFWTTGDTDNAVFRYYIDGEATASIEFTAPKAAGAFFGDGPIWGNAQNGKGGTKGGWYVNYKIPFGRSI